MGGFGSRPTIFDVVSGGFNDLIKIKIVDEEQSVQYIFKIQATLTIGKRFA